MKYLSKKVHIRPMKVDGVVLECRAFYWGEVKYKVQYLAPPLLGSSMPNLRMDWFDEEMLSLASKTLNLDAAVNAERLAEKILQRTMKHFDPSGYVKGFSSLLKSHGLMVS